MLFHAYYLGRHGDAPLALSSVPEMNALIDDLLRQDPDHRLASVSEAGEAVVGYSSELMIGVDDGGDSGVLCHWGNDGRFFSLGSTNEPGERDYYLCGSSFRFPASARIPLAEVRAGAAEFVESGGEIPRKIEWREAT